ncbi:MAG: hypothetical protein HND57_17375 [Planctomycetes bacterium]|nr:hypothetical protein [Planctomycetota bacterium]
MRRCADIRSLVAVALMVSTVMVSTASPDELVLRDGGGTLIGLSLDMDDSGILFRVGHDQAQWITWDRVRSLSAEDETNQAAYQAQAAMAETLWRARSRVERGDSVMAEPLLIPLFETTRGRTDAVALIVAEGLLRCHLARGDRAAALVPWLECVRLRQAGLVQTAYASLSPVLDGRTGLCLALPPIWTPGDPNADRAADELGRYLVAVPETESDSESRHLAVLYLSAARGALADPTRRDRVTADSLFESLEALANADVRDAGTFVLSLVMAIDTKSLDSQRATAIRILSRMTREPGRFGQWARYATGLAKVRQPGADQRLEGLVDLLSLPALVTAGEKNVDRILAGLALEQAAEVLAQDGRSQEAASLRTELIAIYPDHPVHRRTDITASNKGPDTENGS